MTTKEITQPTIIVECIKEPRGDFGLEGYQLGESYLAKLIEVQTKEKPYIVYRVWPVVGDSYFEVCTERAFKQHFKEVVRPMETMLDH